MSSGSSPATRWAARSVPAPSTPPPSVLDGIVWVVTPAAATETRRRRPARGLDRAGRGQAGPHGSRASRPAHRRRQPPPAGGLDDADGPGRDRRGGRPEILRLAAGGFRDLTRLAASDPALWSEILLANRDAIATAIDRYSERLGAMRDLVARGDADAIAAVFAEAKAARLTLAAKPQVRAGVAVLQVPVPDRPGVLADVTSAMGQADVNIEDLQIVHSPEGGRGTLHVTVAVDAADPAEVALRDHGFDPVRIA